MIPFIVHRCPALPPLGNGTIHYFDESVESSSFPIGTYAIHECNGYFSLKGKRIRVCNQDGSWSPPSPTCKCKFILNVHA